jgi:hypothetical protein
MESPGDALALEADRETVKLYKWRLAELERAGYDPASASLIAAELKVDLHVAIQLVKRGCSIETALRILL